MTEVEIDFDILRVRLQSQYNSVVGICNSCIDSETHTITINDIHRLSHQLGALRESIGFLFALTKQTTEINDISRLVRLEQIEF